MMKLMILTVVGMLAGCASQPVAVEPDPGIDILTVQQDGTMVFKNRTLPEKDVVIYADGWGGERAAVKVRVPLKPDFYRDSIRVYREEPDPAVIQHTDL